MRVIDYCRFVGVGVLKAGMAYGTAFTTAMIVESDRSSWLVAFGLGLTVLCLASLVRTVDEFGRREAIIRAMDEAEPRRAVADAAARTSGHAGLHLDGAGRAVGQLHGDN